MRNREARGEGSSKSEERSMLDQARAGSHIPRAAVSAVTKAFRDPASNWSLTPRADQSARALHARRGPFFWRAQPRRRQRGVAAADRAWPPSWIFERERKKKATIFPRQSLVPPRPRFVTLAGDGVLRATLPPRWGFGRI